jgi:hypothetical protein
MLTAKYIYIGIALVDDRNTSLAWYGDWSLEGGKSEYQQTTHGAHVGTSGIAVEMEFNGSSSSHAIYYGWDTYTCIGTEVSFWGTLEVSTTQDAASITFEVDGNKEDVVIPGSPKLVFHQELWKVSTLYFSCPIFLC